MKILELLKTNKLAVIMGVVVLLLIAATTASWLRPAEVKYVEKVKEVYVDKIVEVHVKDTTTSENEHKKDNQVIKQDTTTVKRTDGTVETHETKTTTTQNEVIKTVIQIQKVTEYVDREKIVYKEKEILKETKVEKDWRVGLKAGTSITGLKVSPTAPYIDPIILQIDGERRIIGGLYGGVWVQTSSFKTVEVGIGLSLVF